MNQTHDAHDENSEHADDDHGHDDHGGTAKYLTVFGSLIVLTVISFWLGNSGIKDTAPQVAWAGMMAVSCAKALLVMLFFMHLIWEANWKYVLTIPASLMSLFLVLALVPDVGLRTHHYNLRRWTHASEPNTSVHIESEEEDGHSHEKPDTDEEPRP